MSGKLIRNSNHIGISLVDNWSLADNFTVPNDLDVYGALNLNGHTLKVNGNFKTSTDDAVVIMQKSDDKLVVNGDITFAGSSTVGDLTKGTIEVTGNFYQVGTGNNNDWGKHSSNNKYSFYASDDNKVVFKGTQKQTIAFDSNKSQFANIDIENQDVTMDQITRAEGVLYTTPELYNSIYRSGSKLIYTKYLDSRYEYMAIKAGMNFIALPDNSDLNLTAIENIFDGNITTVWTFDAGRWKGYSSLSEKQQKFSEDNISTLGTLHHGEGIIVNTLTDQTLLFPKGENYSIKDVSGVGYLNTGWHLLGTNKSISVAELEALNPNIVSVWSFDTQKWSATATETDFIANIEKREITSLETIPSNSAFWVYVK